MSTTVEPTPTAAPPRAAYARGVGLHRLTSEQYCRMIDAGILSHGDKVELWEGLLVAKMTKNRPHVIALDNLSDQLRPLLPVGFHAAQEAPIVVDDNKVPEPDFAVIRGTRRDYPRRPPAGSDVALVVEVAESSLPKDLGAMLVAYSRQMIPIYWVVNLIANRIEVYEDPAATGVYGRRTEYRSGDAVPVVLDGREVGRIAVDQVLP